MHQPQTHTRPNAPPAKAWRNYYRLYRVLDLGWGPWFPGIHPGPSVFPSQDVAETHAEAFLRFMNPPGRWLVDFAGAFPEGERAN
ncbi:MAG: hypothetical protein ABUL42_04345 [Terricaulis silvestris]